MNNIYKTIVITLLGIFIIPTQLMAGNRDRSGQAGAQHLLIDPWARSAGWSTVGVAETRGLESIYSNIAGMSFVKKTEIAFSRVQYISGSKTGIGVNAFAISQHLTKKDKESGAVKDLGVLGVSLFSQTLGEIMNTTVDQPEGNLGYFSPNLLYIGVHYARKFNDYIFGGFTGKIINESISNMSATGFCFDIGVQYRAGAYENFKIGITLKNMGLPMRYSGDGISLSATPTGTDHEVTLQQRSALMEMPSLLTIGISYDFLFFGKNYSSYTKEDLKKEGLTRDDAEHRITLAGSFTANSYSRDNFSFGIEYGLMQIFMVRAGFLAEQGMFNPEQVTTFYSGPSAGATFAIPLAGKNSKGDKGDKKLYLDYGYRFLNKWKGNHYVSLKLML